MANKQSLKMEQMYSVGPELTIFSKFVGNIGLSSPSKYIYFTFILVYHVTINL